jgi:hypothetical protein
VRQERRVTRHTDENGTFAAAALGPKRRPGNGKGAITVALASTEETAG